MHSSHLTTKIVLLALNLIAVFSNGVAQSTYQEVAIVLQTGCTVGCHSGASPSAQLDLSGDLATVYQNLINVNPLNPEALSTGMKLVDPGYPERSFLFAKVAHDIDPIDYLTPAMGSDMPSGQQALAYRDIELIRQWILFGASETATYLDSDILTSYYDGLGMNRIEPLAPPPANEGFQIHYGPFFLLPLTEVEYFYKYATKLPENREVNRMETKINEESHHTAIYRYFPEQDTNFLPGLRPVTNVLVAAGVYYTSDILSQFPNSQDLVLPEGTAFTLPANVVMDVNYHIPNYSADSILPAELYLNVYTQPAGTAQQEMIAGPIYYGGEDPTTLMIPPTGEDSTYTMHQFDADSNYTWYIWSIMAHTHQLGKDYQVYRRTADGEKGENVYNGFYNPTYSFNTGAYDWSHPPFRIFDDFLEVNFAEGLIHEAVFNNSGTDNVYFGLQTTDEMYVSYIQYIRERVSIGVEENGVAQTPEISVYPNPATGPIQIVVQSDVNEHAILSFWNELGQMVYSSPIDLTIGKQTLPISISNQHLSSGLYAIRLASSSQHRTVKLMVP